MVGRSANGGDDHSDLEGPTTYRSHSLDIAVGDDVDEKMVSAVYVNCVLFEEWKRRYYSLL